MKGGPALIRAQDLGSSTAAEAELQRTLASLRERRDPDVRRWWVPRRAPASLQLLAHELAGDPADGAAWRRYADWARAIGDPRGELVELHESLDLAEHPQQREALQRRLTALEQGHFAGWRERLI
ncbi:MAG: hypothetical protein KC457_33475, partial [Myxococcales bacterium]|nr:hypothetical protein [Myxococcales bacterium]